jgi:pimeloyl-ACP methyl ester carboxylesterase
VGFVTVRSTKGRRRAAAAALRRFGASEAGVRREKSGAVSLAIARDDTRGRRNLSRIEKAARDDAEAGTVVVDGLRVRYARRGAAGRPVVLVHGNSGSTFDYTSSGALELLGSEFRAVAVDRPGHGFSDRLRGRGAGSPSRQAAHLAAAVRALSLERPILVGHSFGGTVVLAWALDRPEEVDAVVGLEGTFFAEPRLLEPAYPWLARRVLGRPLSALAAVTIAETRMRRRLEAAFAPDPLPAAYLESARALFLRPSNLRATAEDALQRAEEVEALAPRWASLAVPLELVAAESDGYVPPENHSYRLHRDVKGSALTALPKTGHQVPQTRPRAVLEAVRRAAARSRAC